MLNEGLVSPASQEGCQFFSNHDRPVASPGTADCNGEVSLPFLNIGGNREGHEIVQLLKKRLRERILLNEIDNSRLLPSARFFAAELNPQAEDRVLASDP